MAPENRRVKTKITLHNRRSAMPSGLAAAMRAALALQDRSQLVLERNPLSATGFVNVIKVKNGKFQARLQVKGEGRGGSLKRKQHSLPGLFDTAEDAAVVLAAIKRDMKDKNDGRIVIPPKFNKQHKPRSKKPAAPRLVHESEVTPGPATACATVFAEHVSSVLLHVPIVSATPLPPPSFRFVLAL